MQLLLHFSFESIEIKETVVELLTIVFVLCYLLLFILVLILRKEKILEVNWVQGQGSQQTTCTGTRCLYTAEKSEELSSHIS